jgi:cytochrome c biogenesis protein CcmG/thiol:disulfide interchange protein DsbE
MNRHARNWRDESGGITVLISMVICGAALITVLVLGVTRQGTGTEGATDKENSAKPPAPEFNLKDLEGNQIKLSDYKGKVMVLNFWATWCTPCRAEIPAFVKLREQYHDRGFEIIGVSLDEDATEAVARFAKNLKINYPIAMGNPEIVQAYGPIESIPMTFIIDRQGRLYGFIRGMVAHDQFEKIITPLLEAGS